MATQKQYGYVFSYVADVGNGQTQWGEKVLYTSRPIAIDADLTFIKSELGKDCGKSADSITIVGICPLKGESA